MRERYRIPRSLIDDDKLRARPRKIISATSRKVFSATSTTPARDEDAMSLSIKYLSLSVATLM